MKRKFEFKRLLLVGFLAVAGLFGASSFLVNNISDSNPKAAKADGREIIISITKNGWNTHHGAVWDKGEWYQTDIFFYASDDLVAINSNPFTSYLRSDDITVDRDHVVDEVGHATVGVPTGAKSFVIRAQNDDTNLYNRTYPQLIPEENTGLDTFTVDTNDGSTQQKGYWSHSSGTLVQSIYLDRKNTAYFEDTFYVVYWRRGNYITSGGEVRTYEGVVIDDTTYFDFASFSSTCYGGVEYSDAYTLKTGTTISYFSFFNARSASGRVTDPIVIPASGTPSMYKLSANEWVDAPERMDVVVDLRYTTTWYSNDSPNYTKVEMHYKNSGGSDFEVENLSTTTIDGVTYGISKMAFGTSSFWLRYNPGGTVYYCMTTYDWNGDLSPLVGHNYMFIRTTTDKPGSFITSESDKQELERSLPDGYYLCGIGGWAFPTNLIKLDEGDTGFYNAFNVAITSANTTFKPVRVGLNNRNPGILIYYKYDYGESLIPSRYHIYDDGTNDHNFKIETVATYTITAHSFHEEYGNDKCKVIIDPYVTLTLKVNDTAVGTFVRDDVGKGAGEASQYSISGYTAPKDGVITIFDGSTNITSDITVDSGIYNNIYRDTYLKFLIEDGEKIYLKFCTDSSNKIYQDGPSHNTHGVKTGLTFYVYDPDSYWTIYTPDIFVRFELPNDRFHSKYWIVKCSSYNATHKSWICEVPGIDGGATTATWTVIKVYRYASGATTDGSSITGTEYTIIENLGALSEDYYNSVKITAAASGNGAYYLYSDAGMESGNGIYADTSSAWGNWNVDNYKVFARFVGIIGGSSSAEEWVELVLIPGETRFYEGEVPQYSDSDVEWAGVQLVYSTAKNVWTGQKKYESQFFVLNSYNKGFQHFYFTGGRNNEYESVATCDDEYTDVSRANSWGSRFVSSSAGIGVKCYGGVTPPSTTEWDTMGEELDQTSSAVKNIVKTATGNVGGTGVEQGVARYDYIIHIYGTDTYDDYAERTDTANGGAYAYGAIRNNHSIYGLGVVDDNASVILIIIASSVSILSITALSVLLVKKKKSAIK